MADWKLRRQILRAACFLLVLTGLLAVYIVYLTTWDADSLAENPLNARTAAARADIWRGSIIDDKGNVLAETGSDGQRHYPYGEVMAPVTGYNGDKIGSAGIEAHANRELLGLTADMGRLGPISQLLQADRGNDVHLTIDADVQQAAYKALQGRKGAIVVLDANTGGVIAMVSQPSYDPNNIETEWKALSQAESSPLLNRAVQGLYPPGSTIKPLIADEALSTGTVTESDTFDCTGALDVGGGQTIKDSSGEVHGRLNIREAIAESCNYTFGTIGMRLGDEKLKDAFHRFGFDREIGGDVLMTKSHLPEFGKLGRGDQAQTAIGQSSLLVTPMHMALLAAAFANGGTIMKPYLIDKVVTPGGMTIATTSPTTWLTATTPDMAARIESYMAGVTDHGTGTAARVNGITVVGKTGTAENSSGKEHAWFIGSAEVGGRRAAFAIIVENGGSGGRVAAPIARRIIEALNKK